MADFAQLYGKYQVEYFGKQVKFRVDGIIIHRVWHVLI